MTDSEERVTSASKQPRSPSSAKEVWAAHRKTGRNPGSAQPSRVPTVPPRKEVIDHRRGAFIDLGAMKAVFFAVGDIAEDMNGDGAVNFLDLGLFKGYMFHPPGPSGVPNICPGP